MDDDIYTRWLNKNVNTLHRVIMEDCEGRSAPDNFLLYYVRAARDIKSGKRQLPANLHNEDDFQEQTVDAAPF